MMKAQPTNSHIIDSAPIEDDRGSQIKRNDAASSPADCPH